MGCISGIGGNRVGVDNFVPGAISKDAGMKTMIGFFKKEIIHLWRTPALLVAVLIMPAVQILVLSGAITMQAKNLRLALSVSPNDTVMMQIYNHAIGSGYFIRAKDTGLDAVNAVQNGIADVAIIAPGGGLTRQYATGAAQAQVLIDSMNILKAQSIEAYINGVIMTAAADAGIRPSSVPLRFETRILFNPQLNTKWFMVPSLIACMVLITLLIMITTAITQEKEVGTFETLLSAPISKYQIIVGKTLPYIFIAFIVMLSLILVGRLAFGVPFVGSWVMMFLAFAVFCVPGAGIAVWLADYTKTQQQALLGIVIVAFLCLMLSSAMLPCENFPTLLRYISFCNPLTHFVYLVRNIMLKGATWQYFLYHAAIMMVAGVVVWVMALRKFKTTLN